MYIKIIIIKQFKNYKQYSIWLTYIIVFKNYIYYFLISILIYGECLNFQGPPPPLNPTLKPVIFNFYN